MFFSLLYERLFAPNYGIPYIASLSVHKHMLHTTFRFISKQSMKDIIHVATVFAKNVARLLGESQSWILELQRALIFIKTRDHVRRATAGATSLMHVIIRSLISQFLSSSSFDVQLLCCYKALCRAFGLLPRHRNKLNFPLLRLPPAATLDAPRALRFQHLDGWYSIQ
jgi:hypothetical protein